jgi:uncharacterized RDD family membrane protein YckC
MSSTPEGNAPDQRRGSTQQGARPDEWSTPRQSNTPGQEQYGEAGTYGQQPDYGQQPPYGQPGQYGQQSPWASRPGRMSPVSQAETRVTWRRIFQYWIDAFFVWIIPDLVSIPFDRSGSTSLHIIGGVVAFVLFLVIGLWYWVIRPHSHNGQTFAMKWFGLRVISKDGGPANMAQLFIRWICLIFDAAPWMWPITGLLGLIVMLCSRYRQRVVDHAARTLVIAADPTYGAQPYRGQPGGTWERHPGTDSTQPDQPVTGQRTGTPGQRDDR